MDFGIASVAAITVICYLIGQVVKASGVDNKWIPIACGVSGGLLGIACMALAVPDFPATDPVTALAVGIVSGFAATGVNQAAKQLSKYHTTDNMRGERTMNANYIYDIFATCEDLDLPDLTIALAHHKEAHPIPEGMTEQGINEFVSNHYEALVDAFAGHDREAFAAAVAAGIQEDEEHQAGQEG